jgi:hypothetical protein
MNINLSEIITDNQLKYSIAVVVYQSNGLISNDVLDANPATAIIIPIDSIENITIHNSLLSPIIHGSILFKDEGGILASNIGSTSLFCEISFSLLDADGNPTNSAFLHKFWISSCDIIDVNNGITTFKFIFTSIHWYTFMSYVNYFMTPTMSGTRHISNLIAQSGLKAFVETSEKENSAEKFPLILPTNWTVLDGIYYCLNKMIELGQSLYFIIYSPADNTYYPWEFSNDQFNEAAALSFNIASIPTRNSFSKDSRLEMKNISMKSYGSQEKIMNFTRGQKNFVYDYNTGKWNKFTHEPENIIKKSLFGGLDPSSILTPGYDTKVKSFPINFSPLINKYTEWSVSARSNNSLWKKLRDFVCTNNILSFTCQGVIERIPGSNFYIDGDFSNLETFTGTAGLAGKWQIMQISHIITKNSYQNEISLSRLSYVKDVTQLLKV